VSSGGLQPQADDEEEEEDVSLEELKRVVSMRLKLETRRQSYLDWQHSVDDKFGPKLRPRSATSPPGGGKEEDALTEEGKVSNKVTPFPTIWEATEPPTCEQRGHLQDHPRDHPLSHRSISLNPLSLETSSSTPSINSSTPLPSPIHGDVLSDSDSGFCQDDKNLTNGFDNGNQNGHQNGHKNGYQNGYQNSYPNDYQNEHQNGSALFSDSIPGYHQTIPDNTTRSGNIISSGDSNYTHNGQWNNYRENHRELENEPVLTSPIVCLTELKIRPSAQDHQESGDSPVEPAFTDEEILKSVDTSKMSVVDRKKRLVNQLDWVKRQLADMRREDVKLAKQLLGLQRQMAALKFSFAWEANSQLIQEATIEIEEREVLQRGDSIDVESVDMEIFDSTTNFAQSRLHHIGVTRMNLNTRRFSMR